MLQYKRGRFTETERAALRDHLDTFRRANRLTDDELLEIIMTKGKTAGRVPYPKFYPELATAVPGRPVRYVKEAVKRMFDPTARKGAWSKEEDADLLAAYEMHPNEWTKVALAVGRNEIDCRDRYRGELKDREGRAKGAWSKEEVEQLTEAVTEAHAQLGTEVTDADTPWQVVVTLMGGARSMTQCRKKWQDSILPGLRAKAAEKGGQLKTTVTRNELLARVRRLKLQHERDITWGTVMGPGWSVTPVAVRGLWHRMKKVIDGVEDMSFDGERSRAR